MRTKHAMLAGLIGACAMSLAMFLMRAVGFNIDLEALLGSVVASNHSLSPWTIGFLIHLAFGMILGVLYGVAFEAVGRAGPMMGTGLGLANGLLAGMMMTSIPAMSPFGGAGGGGGTGAFLAHVHYGPVLFLAAHAVYGLVVGSAYGRTIPHTSLVHKEVT